MKRIALISIILTAVLILVGCGPLFNNGDSVDVILQLEIPDYANHVYPASWGSGSVTSRILDPTTNSVSIDVTATDLTTASYTFDFSNAQRIEGGVWVISCVIPSVRVGVNRTFSASTANSVGTTLTTGSAIQDIYATGNNIVRIPLLPASAIPLTIGATYNGSVAPGEMAYFSISLFTGGTLTVEMTSAAHDVDLYVYNGDGTRYPEQFWVVGTGNETATVTVMAANTVYLCVFGNTAGETNLFTFNPTFVADATDGDLTLMGGSMQGNDLGLTAANADVTTYAGTAGAFGTTDGTGSAARFEVLDAICTDGTYLYIADTGSHTIRQVEIATGAVTTLAGQAGTFGSADGTGTAAQFWAPEGITTDGTNLYVADTFNCTVRQIVIATGAVTTLAGLATVPGSTDGTGSAARFDTPHGITTDNTYVYVADSFNHTIRRIDPATGQVTTIAGAAGITGSTDATGTAARFNFTHEITTDGTYLYIIDGSNHTIRQMNIATGAVTTLAGSVGTFGSTDGIGIAALFGDSGQPPYGITCDGTNLYVFDQGNFTIRKIVIATAEVTTIAGTTGTSGSTDGTGLSAEFSDAWGITTDGTSLFVADSLNYTVRQVN